LAILKATLEEMTTAFPPLAQLSRSPELARVASALVGMDGRRVRKAVSEAMLGRIETVVQPGDLNLQDLLSAALRIKQSEHITQTQSAGGRNGTH
jgi:hypothetical protein